MLLDMMPDKTYTECWLALHRHSKAAAIFVEQRNSQCTSVSAGKLDIQLDCWQQMSGSQEQLLGMSNWPCSGAVDWPDLPAAVPVATAIFQNYGTLDY